MISDQTESAIVQVASDAECLETIAALRRQVAAMQQRNEQLAAEKAAVLADLIDQKSSFEDELVQLRRQLAQASSAGHMPSKELVEEAVAASAAATLAAATISGLSAENYALQSQLRLSEAISEQNKKHEQLILAQQHEINVLSAKVDAFEFVKADYARLTSEFESKSRVADALAKKLSTFTSPPPVDIELLNFQQKISDQLSIFTDTLTKAFGWRIRQTLSGGFTFNRGLVEVCIAADFRVISVKHGPEIVPAGLGLPELLALLTLADVVN